MRSQVNCMFEEEIISALRKSVKGDITLEVPPDRSLGDFAFPCFSLAKEMKKSPVQIAQEIAKTIKIPGIVSKITATGPYVNFFLDPVKVAEKMFADVLSKKDKFGGSQEGKGKTVAIEFSSPNIGKPMHFGHLRSTVIGQSLSLMHEFNGYKVIRLNYLGDWGTQFGKLIYAYLNWGSAEKLKACPIKHLYDLYVKFNEHSEKDEKLQEYARDWFVKLEKGDKEALGLWSKFKHLSVDEFRKIYDVLGVEFDSYNGEAFYAPKTEAAIELIQKKKLAELDQGALIVRLGQDMPMMLKKSNESSTYASRDVATLLDRIETLKFDTILYVVGHEQSLHFVLLFELMRKLGHNENFVHVSHGLYLNPEGGKMATRKGKTVFMEDVLDETISLAKKTIEEKNPDLKKKDDVARLVAVGAILFGDLFNDRVKDVVFDLQRILSFEGDTGPYLLYTHARAASIVKKAGKLKPSADCDVSLLTDPTEEKVIKLMSNFQAKVQDALKQYKPHILAQYLIEFGRAFNEFYHRCPCLQEKNESLKRARLSLIEASRQVIENGLRLLGISAPQEM